MFFIDLATGNAVNSIAEHVPQHIHFTGKQKEDFDLCPIDLQNSFPFYP